MIDEGIGFGKIPQGDYQNEYLNNYVILRPNSTAVVAGRLVKIVQGYFVLNPFQAGKIEDGKVMTYLKDQLPGRSVPISHTEIEPSSIEEIKSYFNDILNKYPTSLQTNKKE